MIADALRVLLFGMLGIFLVMAIIFAVIVALSKISNWLQRKAEAEVIPIDVDSEVFETGESAGEVADAAAGSEGEYYIEEEYVVDDGYGYEGYADEYIEPEVVEVVEA